MTTMLGCAAVDKISTSSVDDGPLLIGVQENDIISAPLMDCVSQTHHIRELIGSGQYKEAMEMRGYVMEQAFDTI
jgi:6-phosphofructokinase 1